jgi:hypothetical protein
MITGHRNTGIGSGGRLRALLALSTAAALTLTACGSEHQDVTTTTPAPACAVPAATEVSVTLNPAGGGRSFDGVGAISSGGNDRYLLDYPERQRNEILDYLFTPGFGASLQLLKAEIGGDANSTDGADASHMHSRDVIDCNASYQFWFMREAKKRNPDIRLAGLAWGAPGWLGSGRYWSQDTIDYLIAWIDCAKSQGLTIDYLGGRNEMGFNRDWYIALRAALDQHYPATQVVAGDTINPFLWSMVDVMVNDPALTASVDTVGLHYPCNDPHCPSPQKAQNLGLPLWASENQASEDGGLARILNREYLDGKFTAFMNWPLITACSDQTAYGGGGGLVEARWPWSGAYTVRRNLWTIAHTTQFTQVGWRYLDQASGYLGADPTRGSYVTIAPPDLSEFTVVVETSQAVAEQSVAVQLDPSLPAKALHVWVSDLQSADDRDHFISSCAAQPADGVVRLLLEPHRLYTVTTLAGGGKGTTQSPAAVPFPLPYRNDFEHDSTGQEARYLANQHGAFQVAPCTGGRLGTCIEQQALRPPNPWLTRFFQAFALLGDASLANYTIRVDALIDGTGGVTLYGRYTNQSSTYLTMHSGYQLQVSSSGTWSLRRSDGGRESVEMAGGPSPVLEPGTWHTLTFTLDESQLSGTLDGALLGSTTDTAYQKGLAGLGCGDGGDRSGWAHNQFDNLALTAVGR